MSEPVLGEADIRAILKLLSEARDVTGFHLRYGNVVIELRNPEKSSRSGENGPSTAGRGSGVPTSAGDRDAGNGAPEAAPRESPASSAQPPWTIIRAPAAGIFRWNRQRRTPDGLVAGIPLSPQTVIGVVEANDTEVPVSVATAAVVRAVLVEDGESVEAGHALAAIVAQPGDQALSPGAG